MSCEDGVITTTREPASASSGGSGSRSRLRLTITASGCSASPRLARHARVASLRTIGP
jgi:hypothetical protein